MKVSESMELDLQSLADVWVLGTEPRALWKISQTPEPSLQPRISRISSISLWRLNVDLRESINQFLNSFFFFFFNFYI